MDFIKMRGIVSGYFLLSFFISLLTASAQTSGTNYWTKPSSGYWEESFWSLSQLPNHDQAGVTFNNPGWKALAIGDNTTASFPGSLSIRNLLIESPVDSANQLLLNHAGLAVPLSIDADLRVVGTNSSLVSHYSALRAGNFYLGGVATFDEQSQATFSQVTVGTNGGPGQLNLMNGFVQAGSVAVNSQSALTVNSGCIVNAGGLALNLPPRGDVAVVNVSGSLGVTNPVDIGVGNFTMSGGYFRTPGVSVFQGELRQSGGTNDSGAMRLPYSWNFNNGRATNYLSGGTLLSSTLTLGDALPGGFTYYNGVFEQTGGVHTNSGGITTWGVLRQALRSTSGTYRLRAGSLGTPSIRLVEGGGFEQSGGTNRAGSIAVENASEFGLSGGSLSSSNTSVRSGYGDRTMYRNLRSFYTQSGGSHNAQTFTSGPGGVASLQAGGLIATDIGVGPNGDLGLTGAAVENSGTFKLFDGGFVAADGNYPQLGKLIVTPGTDWAPVPYSLLDFGSGAATLRFRDSRDVTWDSQLVVTNWTGLVRGGGIDQFYVGTDSQGLTGNQLARIRFANPAGLPAGDYMARILATGEVVPTSTQTTGTNYWTKPSSGFWEEPYWSLGVLPNSSQAVAIANQNWKAVAITASTPINFPDSMTVGSLMIHGAWDTMNTLVLDHVGATPLTVLNGLTVQEMARIVNFSSALVVQGGTIVFTNAEIIQDFGLVRTTNAPMYIQNSQYHLTNGLFEAGLVWLGVPVAASFNQYGGSAIISNLQFGQGDAAAGGTYNLYGGNLNLPNGLTVIGGNNAHSTYLQAGGTNRTTSVYLEPNLFGLSPSFTLNGGLLGDNDVRMVADDFGPITITHNGGTHIVTNTLSVEGGNTHGQTVRPATYSFNGGTLSASTISLAGRQGDALFIQSNGIAQAEVIQAAGSPDWFFRAGVTLAGGTLRSSSVLSGIRSGINQYGGTFVVSNTLDFGAYLFLGGTLSASNINVGGTWVIGSSGGTRRITNSGTCALSGMLQISNAVEQLGRFSLSGNGTIDLAGTASRLTFANSSGQGWAGGATLVVSNWNGSPSGGGADQLKFGTSQSGLTPTQLSQIRFINPAGMPAGTYSARILATGEVVPGTASGPTLGMTRSSNGIVMSWTGNYQLYTSTNVAGPFAPINGATSPYTNSFSGPRRFFILRSP